MTGCFMDVCRYDLLHIILFQLLNIESVEHDLSLCVPCLLLTVSANLNETLHKHCHRYGDYEY